MFQWFYYYMNTVTEPRHSYKSSCKHSPKITLNANFCTKKNVIYYGTGTLVYNYINDISGVLPTNTTILQQLCAADISNERSLTARCAHTRAGVGGARPLCLQYHGA